MGIAALLRETLFGYILYVTYLQRQELDQNISLDIMSFKKFYLLDVLQISE